MKTIGIVAGGPHQNIPDLKKEADSIDVWIGVDSGCDTLLENNLPIDLAIGDFDSLNEASLSSVQAIAKKIQTYPKEKDDTDLEMALKVIQDDNNIKSVYIYGATGGRLDHAWINVQLLASYTSEDIDYWLIDKDNKIAVKKPGTFSIRKDHDFPYVSFISLSEKVEGLSLFGFKYPSNQLTVQFGSSLTVSNELSSKQGTFSFSKGILMVVRSRDVSMT